MSYIFSNLRVLMAERRLNIQDIKNKTNLSRTTISNLVNNNVRGVQFDTVVELCELLKCDISDLFTLVTFNLQAALVKEPYDIQIDKILDDDFIRFKSEWKLKVVYHDKKMEVDVTSDTEVLIKKGVIYDIKSTFYGKGVDDLLMNLDDEYYMTTQYFEIDMINNIAIEITKYFSEYASATIDTMGVLITFNESDY